MNPSQYGKVDAAFVVDEVSTNVIIGRTVGLCTRKRLNGCETSGLVVLTMMESSSLGMILVTGRPLDADKSNVSMFWK